MTLTQDPVVPSADSTRDFSLQGVSDTYLTQELMPAYRRFLVEGMISPLNQTEMHQILKQNNGLGSGDRLRMKDDFLLALVLGFASLDVSAEENQSYVYALHAVRNDGSIDSEPLDRFTLGDLLPLTLDITFSITGKSVTMNWELPAKEFKMRSLTGFRILRSLPDLSASVTILSQPLAASLNQNDTLHYRYSDHSADPTTDYRYSIIPQDVFQQTGTPAEAYYFAEHYKTLQKPVIRMVNLVDETDMQVYWQINEEDSALIRGFVVEVSPDANKSIATLVSDTLPPDMRYFTDVTPKRYGEAYFYHLTTIGKYGQVIGSDPEAFYYLGLVKPPPVSKLSAKPARLDGKTFVQLRWNSKDPGDTITEGYRLYTDELIPDSFLQITSIPLITSPEFLFPITTQGGRVYRFRVAAASKQGKTGLPAEVSLQIGTLRLPMVSKISGELLKNGSILLRWNYPFYPDLKGFHLYQNNKEIAGTDKISGDMRSYLLVNPQIPDNGELVFQLVASGSEVNSEMGMRHSMYLKGKTNTLQSAPGSLQWELISSQAPQKIQLCWSPPEAADSPVTGYLLYSDYSSEGNLLRLGNLPLIKGTEYVYTLENHSRPTVTIGIEAVYASGKKSALTTSVIPLREKDPKNNTIR